MQFSDLLEDFTIKNVYSVRNNILDVDGYLVQLSTKIFYLHTSPQFDGQATLFLKDQKIIIDQLDLKKFHALLRLQRVEPFQLKRKDLIFYSYHIEKKTRELVEKYPRLEKTSAHMAFYPKNYTRFTECILFDFDYIYDDVSTVKEMEQFDNKYHQELVGGYPVSFESKGWDDDLFYRHMTNFVRDHRISINGQIYSPKLLYRLYEYLKIYDDQKLAIYLGPVYLILRDTSDRYNVLQSSRDLSIPSLEDMGYTIVKPDVNMFLHLFGVVHPHES